MRRLPLINSAFAFTLAWLVMITVGKLLYAAAVIRSGTYADPAVGGPQVILLAVPVGALVCGLVVLALPQLPAPHGFWRQAVLWFGLVSVQQFCTDLVVGAFGDSGYFGTVYELLNTPPPVKIILLGIGVAVMYLIAWIAATRFSEQTNPAEEVTSQLRGLCLFGWLLGVALTVMVSIGTFDMAAGGLLEVLFIISAGSFLVFVPVVMKRPLHVQYVTPHFGIPIIGIATLIIIAILRIYILGPGLTLQR